MSQNIWYLFLSHYLFNLEWCPYVDHSMIFYTFQSFISYITYKNCPPCVNLHSSSNKKYFFQMTSILWNYDVKPFDEIFNYTLTFFCFCNSYLSAQSCFQIIQGLWQVILDFLSNLVRDISPAGSGQENEAGNLMKLLQKCSMRQANGRNDVCRVSEICWNLIILMSFPISIKWYTNTIKAFFK